MSSPITLSGFNNVDFGLIIDAILQQERAPIRNLQSLQSGQKSKLNAYRDLGTRLGSFDGALGALSSANSFDLFRATSSAEGVVSASAGVGAATGVHSITVNSLAKAQVLASTSLVASQDTTVADAGSITIGGRAYNVTGSTTLAELRSLINGDADGAARASLVDTGSGLRLVLTAKQTGTAAAFTVENNLTLGGGASAIAFADGDSDGVSGDSASDNSVVATDASLTVDNIDITRSSNVIEGAVPGLTLTLKSAGSATITVDADREAVRGKIESFVDAFNEISTFLQKTILGAEGGTGGPLAGDSIARSASSEIRSVIRQSVDTGGQYRNLAEIGIVFDRTGQLTVDTARLDKALSENLGDVEKLFQSRLEATDSRVSGIAVSAATQPGTYAIDITSVDAPALIAGSNPINNKINSDETLSFTQGALSTNIFLPKNSTIADIVNLVNSGLSAAGITVTASDNGGVLTLTSNQTGSSASFSVVSDVNDQGNGKSTGIGTTLLSATGTDLAGTIGGFPATGVGNVLTADPGSPAAGLQIRVLTSATGNHGTISVESGLISRLESVLDRYVGPGGLIGSVERRIDDAIDSLDRRIADMEQRLVLREEELRRQFTAADQAISTLNNQVQSLDSIGGRLRLF